LILLLSLINADTHWHQFNNMLVGTDIPNPVNEGASCAVGLDFKSRAGQINGSPLQHLRK